MSQNAFVCGVEGISLTPAERDFLSRTRPAGFILFRRNVENPEQVAALIADVREAAGAEDFLVLVDQEGGRVQRLGPPHWRPYPPARAFGRLYRADPELARRRALLAAWL